MPNNWNTYKLSEINSIQIIDGDRGKNYPSKNEFLENGYCLFLSAKNITKTGFEFSELSFISEEKDSLLRKGKLETNDIILTTRGTIGNVGYYKENFVYKNVRINSGMVVIRVDEAKISSSYVYQLFKSSVFQEQISSRTSGSAQPQLPIRDLCLIEINLPENLQEQQSIASILSAIDDKIENNLAINKTLEEMAMALYKHWFVDFGPFQDGEFVQSELGMIPKGWEVKPFLDLFKLLSGGTPKTTVEDYWNGNVYWVSAKDIGSNSGGSYINDTEKKITQLGIDKSAAKILPEDTVIVVARGSVGKFGIIAKPMAINQSCYGIYTKSDYSQALTYLLIKSLMSHFMNVSYGSVFDTITTSTFQNINVLVPPKEIFAEIKKEVDVNFEKIKENIKENQSLTQLRDTLLPQLISGAVRLKEFRE